MLAQLIDKILIELQIKCDQLQ